MKLRVIGALAAFLGMMLTALWGAQAGEREATAWTGAWADVSASAGDVGDLLGVGVGFDYEVAPGIVAGVFARYDTDQIDMDGVWSAAARLGWVPKNDLLVYGFAGVAGVHSDTAALLGLGAELQVWGPAAIKIEYGLIRDPDADDGTFLRTGLAYRF